MSRFSSQTGSSVAGGMFTGLCDTLSSSQAFVPLSATAFGSSMSAIGASSSPAFGASSSSFGSSSVYGQRPASGGFGSTRQSSSFGSSFQQSQPSFGNNLFVSSPFGASSQPPFGAPSTPGFGASNTPASGAANTHASDATSTPAFGATTAPAFGATSTTMPGFGATSTSAFGPTSTPTFGTTGSAFGVSSTSVFGSSTPAIGASSTPAFGASSTPAFGSSPVPALGATSSPFSFWSSPAFGQSISAFRSSPFGDTSTTFGSRSFPFGGQTTTPAFGSPGFGQSSFGGQQRGVSRVTPYAQTPEVDTVSGTQPVGKLESISAMPAYKKKSHEELRWEDYQLGDKGGPNPAAQSCGGIGVNMNNTQQTNPFVSSSTAFGQSSANPFSSTTSTNPFGPKTSTFGTPGFGSSTPSLVSTFGKSPFVAATSNPFGSTPSPAPFAFGQAVPSFRQCTPAFGQSNAFGGNMFSIAPSLVSTSSMGFNHTTPSLSVPFQSVQPTQNTGGFGFGFGSTTPAFSASSTPAFVSSPAPTFRATSYPFSFPPSPAFGQSTSAYHSSPFGTSSAFGAQSCPVGVQTTTPAFGSPVFGQPSFGGQQRGGTRVTPYAQTPADGSDSAGELGSISAMPAYIEKSHEELRWEDYLLGDKGAPNPAALTPTSNTGGFGFGAPAGGTTNTFGQNNFGQPYANQSPALAQPQPITNPFGTLPATLQISVGRVGNAPSTQHRTSSLPVMTQIVINGFLMLSISNA